MNKTLVIITAIASLLPKISLGSDADLAALRGTIANIENALTVAIYSAEDLYEQSNGIRLSQDHHLKSGNSENKYIQMLRIGKDYIITLKFASYRANLSKASQAQAPISQSLINKQIKLIPIYENGDEVITSWECLTDADKDITQFIGGSSTPEYSASFIREYTNHPYLTLCIYVTGLNNVVADYVYGDGQNYKNNIGVNYLTNYLSSHKSINIQVTQDADDNMSVSVSKGSSTNDSIQDIFNTLSNNSTKSAAEIEDDLKHIALNYILEGDGTLNSNYIISGDNYQNNIGQLSVELNAYLHSIRSH